MGYDNNGDRSGFLMIVAIVILIVVLGTLRGADVPSNPMYTPVAPVPQYQHIEDSYNRTCIGYCPSAQ